MSLNIMEGKISLPDNPKTKKATPKGRLKVYKAAIQLRMFSLSLHHMCAAGLDNH